MNNKYLFISILFTIVSHICLAQTGKASFKADTVPTFPDPPAGFHNC